MMAGRTLFTACGLILLLVLTGCQKTPEDIEKWKAAGETAKLVSATGDTRQFMRIAAIEALAAVKDPKAIPPLATLFSDPDSVVVHEAVEAVAAIGGPLSEDPMLIALELKTYPARGTAAVALGNLKSEKAVEPLIKALDDPYVEVVVVAAEALGRIGDPAAIPALCATIKTSSTVEKIACAKALCHLSGEDAVKGLVPTFDEISPEIREIAINAFIELGEPAIPYAYTALRDESPLVQCCGISILQGLDTVPTGGEHAVWYQLAQTSIGEENAVDPEIVDHLVQLGPSTIPILLEGVASPSSRVRETAFLALEHHGEPATELALEEARNHAATDALAWLDHRDNWNGAPSWRLDLWGAATALSPDFKFDSKQKEMLTKRDPNATKIMEWNGFNPTREYIPLLISQFHSSSTEHSSSITFFGVAVESRSEVLTPNPKNLILASGRLAEAGTKAVFPLITGLTDDDPQVSDGCAHVLGIIGDSRAIQPLLEHLKKKIETGESLTFSPFYTALQRLNDPSTQAILVKIRPNAERAERLFRETYTDAEILHIPATNSMNPPSQPISYTIEYLKGGRQAELTITFRKTIHGDWIPHPPLPDSLPE